MSDANAFLMSSGIPSAKFDAVGDHVTGFVFFPPELQQQRDPQNGAAKTWDDGKPMMQLRVVLITEEHDLGPDDDGLRAIYVRGLMQRAIGQAVRAAGAQGLEVGGKLRVIYSGDGVPRQRGFSPPKQYEAMYRPLAPEDRQPNEEQELATLAGQQPPAATPPAPQAQSQNGQPQQPAPQPPRRPAPLPF